MNRGYNTVGDYRQLSGQRLVHPNEFACLASIGGDHWMVKVPVTIG
jgi:hypothetical protein